MLIRPELAAPSRIEQKLLIYFLVIIWSVSCTSPILMTPTIPPTQEARINLGDGGFLSGEPCGPPCFWGIVPGQSTEAEVEEILQKEGVFENCEAYNTEAEGGTRGIRCPSTRDQGFIIGFGRDSDIVDGLGFIPAPKITMEDVIAKYGTPDGVLVFSLGVPEHPYNGYAIVYSRILTHLTLPDSHEGQTYVISTLTTIENIAYDVTFTDPRGELSYEAWKGYGEY